MNQAVPQVTGARSSPGATGEPMSATLSDERRAIFQRLLGGAPPGDVVAGFTDFVDGLIAGRYRNVVRSGDSRLTETGLRHCCLVALGGYGRRELFPFSDIDVMFLYRPEAADHGAALSTAVLHHLWDLGFQVGHSVRTIGDCLDLAASDLTIRTSMLEARFLAGSAELFQEFRHRFTSRIVNRRVDWYILSKIDERQREYEKFGETVYLLEPNVKKSKGGLRDLHLLQWVALARFGVGTLTELANRGVLTRSDYLALTEAKDFLWLVRSLMHLHAGMAQEILSFDEQIWLAERLGYEDRPHLRGVEQFMQQYYRCTMGLHDLSMRFVDRSRSVSLWTKLSRWIPGPRMEGVFTVEGETITVPADLRMRVLDDPLLLLRLFELAQARNLRIDAHLLDLIHHSVKEMDEEPFRSPEVGRAFLRIVAGPGPVSSILSTMHKVGLLEKFVPVFATVRGLMQFNQYHKYTVDEHSLLAVGKAEALATDQGILGEVYREIHRKDILHLAVLLHDLGKGCEEDHSEVGQRIAEDLADRLVMDEQDRRTLTFLVRQHLLMSHTAFRRDPYDEKVLLPFVRAVGTPEVLRKLLVLTAADIAAVGPGVLTKWKESLLIELYLRALPELSGEREAPNDPGRLLRVVREVQAALTAMGADPMSDSDIAKELGRFPVRYMHATPPARIAMHLTAVRRLAPGEVVVETDFHADLGTCEYTVITWNSVTPGLFSKIAGVLAAHGLRILDAQILTRGDDVVLDRFQVQDPDFMGAPPLERRLEVSETIRRVLKGLESVEALLARGGRLGVDRRASVLRQSTEVRLDQETHDRLTIIDVFADDRQGMLYVIAKTIFELGLSVHAARISTRLDQVADVFYVTDARGGGKIEESSRREEIRTTLKKAIDEYLDQRPRDY